MKNYKEIAENVFARRAQYETQKRNKQKMLVRTCTPIACVCVISVVGVGLWQGGVFEKEPPITVSDAVYPGIKDNFDVSKGESPDDPTLNNRIIINQINGVGSDKMDICLFRDDFVKMSKSEMNEYYGVNIFPEVPDDIKEWEDQNYGIFKSNGGTGEVYYDLTALNYNNGDFSRCVNMEVKKNGALPFLNYVFVNSPEEKSVINNWEVAIGYSESSGYHAFFMYYDVCFYVSARGLSQDEFVSVLSSIIK